MFNFNQILSRHLQACILNFNQILSNRWKFSNACIKGCINACMSYFSSFPPFIVDELVFAWGVRKVTSGCPYATYIVNYYRFWSNDIECTFSTGANVGRFLKLFCFLVFLLSFTKFEIVSKIFILKVKRFLTRTTSYLRFKLVIFS